MTTPAQRAEALEGSALPLGKTCLDCHWWTRCNTVFGVAQLGQVACDWIPPRFSPRPPLVVMRQVECASFDANGAPV